MDNKGCRQPCREALWGPQPHPTGMSTFWKEMNDVSVLRTISTQFMKISFVVNFGCNYS